ncbi:MAG: hypothetical protein HYW24_05205 [Candidatus Aenigmarchaeota archaeon]|nr:hypothetical protein [Candidatus Aenigmarchaeota archaeon]
MSVNKNVTSKEMVKLQTQLTKNALDIAKGFGIDLDFSHESIKQVEKILADIHEEYKKTKNEEGLRGIAISFAAYIISVIERNSGKGKWERNHPKIGPDTFPFSWRDSYLFPYGWCVKRIYDGKSDNVWVKYKVCVLDKK